MNRYRDSGELLCCITAALGVLRYSLYNIDKSRG